MEAGLNDSEVGFSICDVSMGKGTMVSGVAHIIQRSLTQGWFLQARVCSLCTHKDSSFLLGFCSAQGSGCSDATV